MKILLIYSVPSEFQAAEDFKISFGSFIPPLGLLYLGKMLSQHGHHVQVIDCTAEKKPDDAVRRALPNADAVGMTIYSGKSRHVSTHIASIIRDHDSQLPIILGGQHLTLYPQQALIEHQAQIGVQGEAEYRINPVIDAIAGTTPLSSIPGITYRENGSFHQTEPAPQIIDLDSLPFPDRDLVKHYQYGYVSGLKLIPGVVTSMMTSRGCPFRCRFCQESTFLPQYASHSADRINAEIDDIVDHGYTSIAFADDNFLAYKKRTEHVMDHIITQGYDLKLWIVNARVDSADPVLYNKLRKAGVEHIMFGVESGDQDILNYYHKKITLDQIRTAVTLSHDMGFFTTANFIFGAPIETSTHINHTIAFINSLPLDNVIIKELGLVAGSPLWQEALDQGKITPDEDICSAAKERGLGPLTSTQLKRYIAQTYLGFAFNPRTIIRQLRYAIQHHNPNYLRIGARTLLETMT